jgi:hypothetical protein
MCVWWGVLHKNSLAHTFPHCSVWCTTPFLIEKNSFTPDSRLSRDLATILINRVAVHAMGCAHSLTHARSHARDQYQLLSCSIIASSIRNRDSLLTPHTTRAYRWQCPHQSSRIFRPCRRCTTRTLPRDPPRSAAPHWSSRQRDLLRYRTTVRPGSNRTAHSPLPRDRNHSHSSTVSCF